MTHNLTFQNHTLTIVNHDSGIWFTSADLSRALGYSDCRKISHLFSRNQDEFTSDMSLVLNLGTKGYGNGNSQKEVRIFSLRGAHLVAMFARTPVAKEFRRWVLDILDRETRQKEQTSHAPTRKTPALTKRELEAHIVGGRLLVSFLPGGAAHYRLLDRAEVIIDKAERDYLRSQVQGLKSGLSMCSTIVGHIDDLSTALKGV